MGRSPGLWVGEMRRGGGRRLGTAFGDLLSTIS